MNMGGFFARIARPLLLAAIISMPLTGCGYQWQGGEGASTSSVLGAGGSTVKIVEVEQSFALPLGAVLSAYSDAGTR